jgi:serine/threonine protein kinase
MFCSICCKIRCLLNKCISFRLSHPMKRYNTYRRPRHTYLNCRHKCSVHKSPQQTYKESSFTNNKLHHSKMLSIYNFRCVAVKGTFTTNVTPPYTCSVSQTGKCQGLNSTCSCITMEKHYSRNSLKQDTQSGLRRPWARVNLVKAVMRSSIRSALHIFLLCKKRRITIIFIFNKKSHYFNKKQK